MKKTLIALVFIMTLIFALAIFNASAANEGTPISNAEEFETLLTANPQGTYYLTGDIDFGGKEITNYLLNDFSGSLDGNGHSIFNFSLTSTSGDSGLIKQLAQKGNAIIKNISFGKEGAPIASAPKTANSHAIIAGSVFRAYGIFLEDVNVYANINAEVPSGNIGGLVGWGRDCLAINCNVYGNIKAKNTTAAGGALGLGGFFGTTHIGITIINGANNANVELFTAGGDSKVGGLVGHSQCAHIVDGCINNGNVSVKNLTGEAQTEHGYAGGIIGWVNSNGYATLNCTNTGTISAGSAGAMIGIVNSHNAYVEGCTYTGNAVGKVNEGCLVYVDSELNSSSAAIDTPEKFEEALKSGGGVYHLTNDINFNGKVFEDNITTSFKGIIDGRGFSVYGFSLVGKTDNANLAMISQEKNGFVMVNINLGKEDAPIVLKNAISSDSSRHDYAIVCGNTDNTIMANVNVYADIDTNSTAKTYTAGVSGYNRYSLYIGVNVYGEIVGGSANPDVVGTYYQNVSGIVGGGEGNNVMLYKCKNYADVTCGYTSSAEGRAAGLMAYTNQATSFIFCENHGDITVLGNTKGSGQAAGFLCDNNANNQGSAIFYKSANYGKVIACGYAGAFVGRTRGAACSNMIVYSGSIDITKDVDVASVSYIGNPVARTNERPTVAVDFKVLADGEPLIPEPPVEPEPPTPPTFDMIVCVLGAAMISAIGASVIVYRKRRSLSK